jgi:hypothetical protein
VDGARVDMLLLRKKRERRTEDRREGGART